MLSKNIQTFSLEKENRSCKVNIIKKDSTKEISIVVEIDYDDSFHSYSTRIAINNIVNNENKELNLLEYFIKKGLL